MPPTPTHQPRAELHPREAQRSASACSIPSPVTHRLVSAGARSTLLLAFALLPLVLTAEESWPQAFSRMPLNPAINLLTRTNCVEVMLGSLQANPIVKGLVFLPGATDELYMFKRAQAVLTNAAPSLLDAVIALTNQTLIRATFYPPLLLLHTDEDPLEPIIHIRNQAAANKLKRTRFVAHAVYNDRDWDFLQPILSSSLGSDLKPWRHSYDSWHFYRHSFAGWGLTGWEALQAAAFAGKTGFTVERKTVFELCGTRVIFEADARYLSTPKLSAFPR